MLNEVRDLGSGQQSDKVIIARRRGAVDVDHQKLDLSPDSRCCLVEASVQNGRQFCSRVSLSELLLNRNRVERFESRSQSGDKGAKQLPKPSKRRLQNPQRCLWKQRQPVVRICLLLPLLLVASLRSVVCAINAGQLSLPQAHLGLGPAQQRFQHRVSADAACCCSIVEEVFQNESCRSLDISVVILPNVTTSPLWQP
eukprot:TRINITY_DN12508_c0_g1_i1.p1 TRINITY_DN12508_c0_g1~~TRINITY_DN12508_c0_g1_i1.p1  ORF type:complete len:198 (-),score=11.04 TRINITY_DN12508_c0_g1_i1:629-1222(-)